MVTFRAKSQYELTPTPSQKIQEKALQFLFQFYTSSDATTFRRTNQKSAIDLRKYEIKKIIVIDSKLLNYIINFLNFECH